MLKLNYCEAQNVWQNVGNGLGTNANHSCLTLLNDTIDNLLYSGGTFKVADDTISCDGIAYWNGNIWGSNLPYPPNGSGLPFVSSLTLYNGSIYGGSGTVFHFDGANWVIDGDASNEVYCLCVYHNKLFVGGDFTDVDGISAKGIACFNGTTWSDVGGGVQWTQACCSNVKAMCVWNDKLYVGGTFDKAGNLDSVNSIACWNDTTWSRLGTGLYQTTTGVPNAYVYAIDNYKNELYIGGRINLAGSVGVWGICRWNDTTWNDVDGGIGVGGEVRCFLRKDSSLYVGGGFGGVGGLANTNGIARWDGVNWHNIGNEDFQNGGEVFCMAEYENELYIGGNFLEIGTIQALNIAKYGIYNSINEVKETEFNLYPNPVTDKLTIQSTEYIHSVKVNNVLGEIIFTQNYSSAKNEVEISVADLPAGFYLLRVQTKSGWSTGRFVKE